MTLATKNNNILKWLKKPYFFNQQIGFKLSVSFGMGIFVYLFLIILKPLDVKRLTQNINLYSVYCGVIITITLLFYFFVITKLFPKFYNNSSWNIGKHIFTVIMLMLLCSLFIWLYNQYVSYETLLKTESFLSITSYVFNIGFFPLLIYLFVDERYGNHYKNYELRKTNKTNIFLKKPYKKHVVNKVIIYASNNKDYVTFDINNLVYITSQANYVSLFLNEENNILKEKIIRIQLQAVEKKLESYSQIIRCHKSYIVNTHFLQRITGNARGYYLQLLKVQKEIPVSRKFNKKELITFINP